MVGGSLLKKTLKQKKILYWSQKRNIGSIFKNQLYLRQINLNKTISTFLKLTSNRIRIFWVLENSLLINMTIIKLNKLKLIQRKILDILIIPIINEEN